MKITKTVCKFLKRNGPLLLTIGSAAGVVATAVLTGKAVLKAEEIMKNTEDLKTASAETKKKILSVYIPPVLTGAATIGCVVGAHVLNKNIQAGLISAYGLLDASFKNYRLKLDEQRDKEIMSEIRYEQITQQLPDILEKCPGEGYMLWKDDYRKRPFWARESDVLRACNHLNKQLIANNIGRGYVGLDEFYEFVYGEREDQDFLWGWTEYYMYNEWDCGLLEVDWTEDGVYTDENGKEHRCNYIHWWCEPMLNYLDYDE